ncbi:MAG: cytochrome c oxidase subunit II [Calditrichaceae bacterium]|jgi:cytochrome c oxidase subunit II
MKEIWTSIEQFFAYLFHSASPQARDINTLFFQFTIISAIIVLIIAGAIIYSAIRFRASKRPETPPQISGNKKLEITWTVVPFLLLTFFFYLTVKAMKDINQPVTNRNPDIKIIAHQWWWDMRYPDYNIITANELHIPAGKRLLMEFESADVIHSWWVPELGRKTDVVPGRQNYGWIEADTAGVYPGKCSEYCGTEHAWMLIRVVAEPQEKFEQWVKHQQKTPHPPTDSLALAGRSIFQRKACAGCHAIRGTAATSHMGPDLTHLASRKTLLSGMLNNNKQNLREWLKNPQKIKPGANMPNFMLSKNEIDELTDYLEGLQ